MKTLLKVTNKDELKEIKVDGYILSLKDFSVNFDYSMSLKEIITFASSVKDKEVYININTNILNNQLLELKKILKQLTSTKIKVMFYDLAVLRICNINNYCLELIYNAPNYNTNFETINTHRVMGAVLSNEIRREEIKEIKEKTTCKIYLDIFGHIPLMTTRRQLIKNYLTYIKHNDECSNCLVEEVNSHEKYHLIEYENLATLYSKDFINYYNDKILEYLDYGIINTKFTGLEVMEIIDNKFPPKLNFLETETIYKVGGKNE